MLVSSDNTLTADHINTLISNRTEEQRTLDYKGRLPSTHDKEKAEFCKDVSSFANTVGGHIIFGIDEAIDADTKRGLGYPDQQKPVGLKESNIHERIHDLEQVLLSGLDPRLADVKIYPVEGVGPEGKGVVLVVQIPSSWQKPHRVVSSLVAPFWMRHSKGAFALNTAEIRSSILASEGVVERTRNFTLQRLSAILADEAPRATNDKPLLALHVIPIAAFTTDLQIDSEALKLVMGTTMPFYGGVDHHYYNLEGFAQVGDDSYLQVFRSGVLESVSFGLLRNDSNKNVPIGLIEQEITESVFTALRYYNKVSILPPFTVSLQLANVRGFSLRSSGFDPRPPIKRDTVALPFVNLPTMPENYTEVGTALRPLFDALANLVHIPRSDSFDDNGNYTGARSR